MRYIDLDSLLPDVAELVAAAERAREEISQEADWRKRSELIERHRDKWVAFRPYLATLSHGKCWYTESLNPGTDDDVDHFRPKRRVAEDETHGGYWWEALHWRNFRLSCHHSNRLRENPEIGRTHGKGDHFPLMNPQDRCRTPDDDLARECPMLLDPADPFDPPLLTFNMDGTVALSPDFKDDADALTRVEASRVCLHLDWPAIKEQRRDIYRRISVMINDGQIQEKRVRCGDVGSKNALRAIARDLVEMTRESQPYSAAAKAYIAMFRHVAWVRSAVLLNVR